ncbi:radical SAM/CxCxxxxC motif protein YfkAB [Thermicanus aegyptius]|uniref:radical SAM/CxCxxxxC motif protein YfkAB n=1 Tax=Thermicanus aegyptius TaxID=94009 RepID=UPI0003FC7054|nr:radical SAM/CxCxxxxC motif protein YfkAB [Thermicanus aegyptius]
MDRTNRQEISPAYDPWESIHHRIAHGRDLLTSVEFTVTHQCNLRCEHCAVGEDLLVGEPDGRIPLHLLLERLDEIEHLETISITGGEPLFNHEMVRDYVVPLLRYAHNRGAKTQLNSNLTLALDRYEEILPFLDVMHISFNYVSAEDFYRITFARMPHKVSYSQAEKIFHRLVENTRKLADMGVFVSAESMISIRTKEKICEIHRWVYEMGCRRHEVHPLYPSDFARDMPLLSLEELRDAYHRLLDAHIPNLWILFGTLPFYPCSGIDEDLQLIKRIHRTPHVTVRNDPDGHIRLNVNVFSGDVIVTDFGDVGPLGNVKEDRLEDCLLRWQSHELFRPYRCFCPQSRCNGPSLLVAKTYYPDVDFSVRKGISISSD